MRGREGGREGAEVARQDDDEELVGVRWCDIRRGSGGEGEGEFFVLIVVRGETRLKEEG